MENSWELEQIKMTALMEKEMIPNLDPEGLCIYFAHNIGISLDEQNIPFKQMEISDYINSNYKHVFLIADYDDKHCLIDPSFGQFVKRENEKIVTFKQWPSEILKSTKEGTRILNDLIKDGVTAVNEEDVKIYLSSFDEKMNSKDIDFSFDSPHKTK